MTDKIKASYKKSKNIYDDTLTQDKWWSRLYIKLFWGGVDDNEIARKVLSYIPSDFNGKLLDVPVGTAVFTVEKYASMSQAQITCLDYSEDMLEQAKARFVGRGIEYVQSLQGDVGNLPFEQESFDVVLSMNGFHAFPDKEKAFAETYRVLKKGGKFISCFYIKGESKITDWLVNTILAKKGWFTAPFDTVRSLRQTLFDKYTIDDFHVEGAMVYFCATKK
ncbi:MAG: class I SAM-dependent methyltransferase [Lachnospiraceae bacterium]|nr:class I SAM-dependent methyltransferase [Lachnospiraceae bacterium]